MIPSWNVFLSEDQWDDYTCNLMFKRKKIMNEESWLFYRLLYSLLVTADRMDAIGVRKIEARQLPSFRNPDFRGKKAVP